MDIKKHITALGFVPKNGTNGIYHKMYVDYAIEIDFEKQNGLVPCIVQEVGTKEVLMLAYMNEESLKKTMETGLATYWSRSRNELWTKGESSGHYQHVKQILVDCDEDTILLVVKQEGAACHTGRHSCFYRTMEGEEIE